MKVWNFASLMVMSRLRMEMFVVRLNNVVSAVGTLLTYMMDEDTSRLCLAVRVIVLEAYVASSRLANTLVDSELVIAVESEVNSVKES
jgi:hypothetical protein